MAVEISWTPAAKSGTTVSGYRPRENGVELAQLGPGVLTYTDTTATSGSSYDVVAYFNDGTTVTSW